MGMRLEVRADDDLLDVRQQPGRDEALGRRPRQGVEQIRQEAGAVAGAGGAGRS